MRVIGTVTSSNGAQTKTHRHHWCATAIIALLLLIVGAGISWLFGEVGAHNPTAAHNFPQQPAESSIVVAPPTRVENLQLITRQTPLEGTENIVIAGLDRRPGAKGSGLTDTIMVVALERRTGRVGLISVPRDIAVDVPKHGRNRINTVYGLAQAAGENAIGALKQSIGDLLALPIKHALVIDLAVFEQLVDTLGGVTVDVTCPIIDDFVDSRTPDGRRVLDVESGSVHMDGATAAMYVRSRHGRSDFSRARRQQAILSALHRELLSLGNLGRLPDVLTTLDRSVSTDLKRYELLALANRALSVRAEQVHAMVIPETAVEPLMDRGRAMLAPKLDEIDAAVAKLFSKAAASTEHQNTPCPPADIALRRKAPVTPATSDVPLTLDNEPPAS